MRVYFSWINARLGYRGFEVPLPRFVQVIKSELMTMMMIFPAW
jgi:hypothetical protein